MNVPAGTRPDDADQDCPMCRGTGCLPDGTLCPDYEAEVARLNAEAAEEVRP